MLIRIPGGGEGGGRSLWQCYRDEPTLDDSDAIIDVPANSDNSSSF